MNIGQAIHNRRKEVGLKQYELAEKAGICGSSLSAYETGTRMPSFDAVESISEAMGECPAIMYIRAIEIKDLPRGKRKTGAGTFLKVQDLLIHILKYENE